MIIGATWEYIVPWKAMCKVWSGKKEHVSIYQLFMNINLPGLPNHLIGINFLLYHMKKTKVQKVLKTCLKSHT